MFETEERVCRRSGHLDADESDRVRLAVGEEREVHVPRDALTSRFALEDAAGWEKLVASGALPASAESILFEWVIDSREPEFKQIHALVA